MIQRVLLLGASVMLVACGPGEHHEPPGMLTISFTPTAPTDPALTLTSAMIVVDRLQPIGNGPPPMPPPPEPLAIDATSPAGASRTFDRLPRGVYSAVIFAVDNPTGPALVAQGTWRGTPFIVRAGQFGGIPVDVRASIGVDIDEGTMATLPVRVDVGAWFAGGILDQATPSGGQIECDMNANPEVAGALLMRVGQSFSLP